MACEDGCHLDCEGHVRRDMLKVGVLGLFGLGLHDLFWMKQAQAEMAAAEKVSAAKEGRAPVKAAPSDGSADQVILIWTAGGMSHIDTLDPKPEAPDNIRGGYRAIATKAPGMQLAEPFVNLAKVAGDVCLIRSMTTNEGAHERGTHYMMTGFPPLPGFGVPSYGSVVAKLMTKRGALPPYIAVPSPVLYGGAGFLGAALDPFSPGGDPGQAGFRVRDLQPEGNLTFERVDRRRTLREAVDASFKQYEASSDAARTVDQFYQAAYGVISSTEARAAFDLTKEPAAMRERYGRDSFGQSLLLSRRLIEAGVRFVTVQNGGWDMHQQVMRNMAGKLPALDRSLAALLGDLKERGLLQRTVVLMMGEFGRTPHINENAGRDHYPTVFSLLAAGGGFQGGVVVGASDKQGTEVADRPVTPPDLSATLYSCLGLDYSTELHSPAGIRILLSRGGTPISEALA
jgi:hypothetical protein